MNSKHLTGAVIAIGIAVIASHFVTRGQIKRAYNINQFGVVSAANGPATPVSAGYLRPPGVWVAPRMYVGNNPGASPLSNPGEDWIQGGGSSVTSTTGRWAA
jgi:hypothetical protein